MAPFTLLLGTISEEKEFSLQKEELPKAFDLASRLFGEAAENRIDRDLCWRYETFWRTLFQVV